ncbi:MAG: helix-turn-helix domain-containing protein, partial [Oscillospiraceae bacterium]|nr:helix-turn-helix domain-containing protein [Oscillospiraceae bacterium]
MSFGKNLQFLRHLRGNMTQEELAGKMNVSRQTVSKWELDTAQPEMEKALELCKLFNCSLDNLFRDDMVTCGESYTNLRVENFPAFRYIKHAVISSIPEGDAIDRVFSIARGCGVDNPRVIGWDFPNVSQEQINCFNMHGYEAAWILPDGVTPPDMEIHEQAAHKYAAVHIENPFENPFVTIPNGYKTLFEYMRVNGLEQTAKDVIPCFETDGDTMDIYIACK